MNEKGKNIIIGLFVIMSCVAIVWSLMYLHPTVGDGGNTLYVRFADIDNISVGTRVHYAGKAVGEVIDISYAKNFRDNEKQRLDVIYPYELTLSIDSSVNVYDSDEIAVHTSGLLGEKSIMIIPRSPREGKDAVLINGGKAYAQISGSIEKSVDELAVLSMSARVAVDNIVDIISENSSKVSTIFSEMEASSENLKEILERVNNADLIDTIQYAASNMGTTMSEATHLLKELRENDFSTKFSSVTNNLADITEAINKPEEIHDIITNVKTLTADLNGLQDRISESWQNIDSSLSNIAGAAENVNVLVEKVSEGKGSIGHFINDEDLYLHGISLMNKFETMMNDVNHYGLLFHLDKGWQRQRSKRINLLHDLSTPQQFKNYFEQEVDQVATSLSRVSLALERIDDDGSADKAQDFSEVFGDLLNQVEGLRDMLRLYNQQYKTEQELTP
ncbi:MAG: MCE family protein [Waddliaceae bacterium]|mgnify:CR=1 FL=1|jgi:phospholipid/cholesterol/gamma-HCH transport system substrate-binding protein|nr:MCE family protein [Waddliaceae bacterium]MBT3579290.1 MCE family protein [Waddliaceae bacterium]MBT4444513.1 MCE family protein [Waddliaceae bacterium]MBT6928441.1 MCE family protein [Waddliaceae bacterium]MBT7264087.1 MCE family protein [Waddliaceae bacterium]